MNIFLFPLFYTVETNYPVVNHMYSLLHSRKTFLTHEPKKDDGGHLVDNLL